jgi:hypothetical protein
MNWEGWERKLACTNLSMCSRICLQELSKTVKTLVKEASLQVHACVQNISYTKEEGHPLNHSAQFLVVHGDKYLLFLLIYPPTTILVASTRKKPETI